MMDDLISRKTVLDAINELLLGPDSTQYIWSSDVLDAVRNVPASDALDAIWNAPTVDAVPVEQLCEWLSDHAGMPLDCVNRLCGQCEFDQVGVGQEMCWKALLTKWMEDEHDHG